jgi:hypothetical protein
MRYLIEIYLTAWEWIQDTRGTLAGRKRRREQKPIWTFLSQGAVGGAIGYFLMLLCCLEIQPGGWSLVYLVILPIFLFLGAVLGVVIGIFIWLVSLLLQRRLGFVARTFVVVSVTTFLGVLLSYLLDMSPTEQPPMVVIVGLAAVLELPMVLMTGSSIRPCHLLLLGAGPRNTRHNFGSWISYPAGFFLRVVSVFGLFESLMLLALWISVTPQEWGGLSAPAYEAALVLAVFYFPTSVYLSFKTPRKALLLPTVVLLNVPMAAGIVHLTNVATEVSIFFSYLLLAPICLWAAYTLGCLIAPAPVQPVIKSWSETMATRIFPTNTCQVQR